MSIFINIKTSIFGAKVLIEMIRFLKYNNPNLHRVLSQFHLTLKACVRYFLSNFNFLIK